MGTITVHRQFRYGKCVECGTEAVIDDEGGPDCPKCDAAEHALQAQLEELERLGLIEAVPEGETGGVSAQQIAVLLAGESPASRAALEEFFPAAAVLAAATEVHVNVDVPAGFVPDFVVTNRATKAVTFNGGQLGQLVTCPRCDKRMTQRMPDEWKCACGVSCTAEGARSEHVRAGFAASKRRAAEAATVPNEKEQAALAFCFRAAAGDSGGQRRVRKFLFAWHNAGELGGFDFADLWSLDEQHLAAVLTLINMIARGQTGYYPHHYGYEADMEALIETYGPEVRS